MSLTSVRAALVAALGTVSGLRVYNDPGAAIDPPGAVLGLSELTWDTYNDAQPAESTTMVYLLVAADDRAIDNLVSLVDQVSDAVWSATDFAITHAVPGTYQTSNVDLPAYVLTVVGSAN